MKNKIISIFFKKKLSLPILQRFSPATTKDVPAIVRGMNKKEKVTYWIFFWIFIASSLGILWMVNDNYLVEVASPGGSFTEGVVGRPGFINPILAISDTDKDLSLLVYSGLLRNSEDDEPILDLAREYFVSEDGLTYSVSLKEDIYWHDGEPITADDVIFTISKIKDPFLKSPARASWEGVTVTKLDEKMVTFELEQPYSLFIDNLTIGILPEHVWNNFSIEDFNNNTFNTSPIGSGPYMIKKIKRNSTGVAEYYDLESFPDFALGEPYIDQIRIYYYSSEEDLLRAFKKGDVDSIGGISSSLITTEYTDRTIRFPLTRIFAVFLNQNESKIFSHSEVRKALSLSADRNKIIEQVLFGYATPIGGPLPPGSIGFVKSPNSLTDKTRAKELLMDNGWELNENGIFEKTINKEKELLRFTLATANIPELKMSALLLKTGWQEIGVEVELKFFEIGDLNQEVIRPRDYEALLFGEITGRDPDPFAFWHSSQRLDPGLNIAMYANITSDKLLEDARRARDEGERISKYAEFQQEVTNDVPAIFLYSPDYLYLPPSNIKNIQRFPVTIGSERFSNIYKWYIKGDKVWEFLNK